MRAPAGISKSGVRSPQFTRLRGLGNLERVYKPPRRDGRQGRQSQPSPAKRLECGVFRRFRTASQSRGQLAALRQPRNTPPSKRISTSLVRGVLPKIADEAAALRFDTRHSITYLAACRDLFPR